MKIITLSILEAAHACSDQCDLFARLYPDGLEVTLENAMVAQDAGLDILWAERLLTAIARVSYQAAIAAARVSHEAAVAAWDNHRTATVPARDNHRTAIVSAWAGYRTAVAAARVSHEAARASAWAVYEAAAAPALVTALISMED
jgi:hypothetical protein